MPQARYATFRVHRLEGILQVVGWASYQKTGEVCGIKLPEGLRESEKLPEAIYTPSTKAEIGDHDENISYERALSFRESIPRKR